MAIHVVLVHPEIHWNTGNAGRSCLAAGATLHLIEPLGFSLDEIVGAKVARKRAPAKAKYANPANRAETWTGRGRKPRWVEAALKSGKSLDDLAI